MKRLFGMLIVLFILYLGIQFVFYWFSEGHDNSYEIVNDKTTFQVNEKSNFNLDIANYTYIVSTDKTNFFFQIFHNYNKSTKVLEKIEYYKDDNYECILPIFKDNMILVDMICKNNEQYNYYFNIKDKNKNLDQFVNNISIYDVNQFIDDVKAEEKEGLNVYDANLIKDHHIGINNYKGVYIASQNINSKVYNISLFDKDVYNQKLGQFVDHYYIVPNYNENHEFHEIEMVDLISLDTFEIVSNKAISFDSYIQGVVDNKIYLFDKDNEIQYEIDPNTKSIVKFSSNEIKYYDGTWSTMTVSEAKNEKKFITNVVDYEDKKYVKVDKVEGVGYYLYKENKNNYDVYYMNLDKTYSIYLFSTQSAENVVYIDNYVYYLMDNTIKVYNDKFGIKNLIEYKELEFNENIKFYVYSG